MKPLAQLYMPGPPPKGLNGSEGLTRRGVAAHKAAKAEWDARVLAAWSQAGKPKVTAPVVLVWVRLFSGRERPMDATNVLASAKVPEDALVGRGFLPDDGPEWVVHSMALQRKVEARERGLLVLAFSARYGLGVALDDLSRWVSSVWEKEDAWRSILGAHSKPYARGYFYPRRGASPEEWEHGLSWDGPWLSRREAHLEVVHRITEPSRGWSKSGVQTGYLNRIRGELAKAGVSITTHSYIEEQVIHGENCGVFLRLHQPGALAVATA